MQPSVQCAEVCVSPEFPELLRHTKKDILECHATSNRLSFPLDKLWGTDDTEMNRLKRRPNTTPLNGDAPQNLRWHNIVCKPTKTATSLPCTYTSDTTAGKKKEGAFNFISGGHTFLTNISLPRAKRWICGYSESIVREEAVPFYTLHFGAPEETLGKRFKGGRGDALLTKKIFDFIFKAEFLPGQ